MDYLYFYLLCVICFFLISWGLWRPERFYQYPCFMGATFGVFIIPQAIALLGNPAEANQQSIARVLLMSCLCALMCWIGYQLSPNLNFIKKFDISVDRNKLLHGGIAFVLISYVFTFLISHYTGVDLYTRHWTGAATIFNFFTGLIYPGLTIILLATCQQPSFAKIILTIWAAVLPLQSIIIYGRRESLAIFLFIIGLSFYFVCRYTPPKWLFIFLLTFALLIIPMTHSYRTISASGDWSKVEELKPVDSFQDYLKQGKYLELRNAALLMDGVVRIGKYEYGLNYWNGLVYNFLPGQLVGHKLKNYLQIKSPVYYYLQYLYNYKIPVGSTITGIADSFIQFDYFGSLFYLLLGYFFKNLWIAAKYRNSVVSQVLYCSLISSAMLTITHQTSHFLPDLLFHFVFLGIVVSYSRNKSLKYGLAQNTR